MPKGIIVYGDAELVDSLNDFNMGWISPTGELFNLSYGCHSSVAKDIVEKLYGITWLQQMDAHLDGEDFLLTKGWAKVFLDVREGTTRSFINEHPTNEMLDLLQALGATPTTYYE